MSAAKQKSAANPSAKSTKQKGYITLKELGLHEKLDMSKRTQDVMMLWGAGHV